MSKQDLLILKEKYHQQYLSGVPGAWLLWKNVKVQLQEIYNEKT